MSALLINAYRRTMLRVYGVKPIVPRNKVMLFVELNRILTSANINPNEYSMVVAIAWKPWLEKKNFSYMYPGIFCGTNALNTYHEHIQKNKSTRIASNSFIKNLIFSLELDFFCMSCNHVESEQLYSKDAIILPTEMLESMKHDNSWQHWYVSKMEGRRPIQEVIDYVCWLNNIPAVGIVTYIQLSDILKRKSVMNKQRRNLLVRKSL